MKAVKIWLLLVLAPFFALAQKINCETNISVDCGVLTASGGLGTGSQTIFCEGQLVEFVNKTDAGQGVDSTYYCWGDGAITTGVGVLYGRLELLDAMPPWQGGGNMIDRVRFEETTYAPVPAKFEAGTAILAGAVGLGAAIDYIQKIGIERIGAHEHALLHAASDQIAQIPGVRLFGSAPGKVSVASFVMQGVDNERIGNHLNTRGIAVRVGHHCAQPTMDRFGVQGMVRPSFAFYNSFDEVDRLIAALYELRTGQGA